MIKISLVKPILNNIDTFDSQNNKTIIFTANSGDQIYANTLEIQKNADSTVIFSEKTTVPYFSLNHIIPSGTLVNGNTYKARIQTFNNNGDASVWSNWILFTCFSDAVIDIINITNGGIVENQSFLFQASYSQAQNNLLQSYKYILYDSTMTQIGTSGLLYDELLSYEFTNFENNKNYTIELQCTTQYNVTVSIKKSFTSNYVQPSFTNFITLTNNPSQATIDVEIVAIRTLGFVSSGTVGIEDNDWANTLNGILTFNNSHGLKIKKSNWTIQMWVKNLIDGKTILTLYGQDNVTFKIVYEFGQFHLYKYIGDVYFAHYRSNNINSTIDNVVYLFCQSENDRINLKCEVTN